MNGFHDAQIEMSHGAGGKASRRLIEGLILPSFSNPALDPLADAALLDAPGTRLAFSADSFVVKPLSFPGGSIGELAVNGTCNDLAVAGAKPWVLSVSFILEAGLDARILETEVAALARAAAAAGVDIVGGDTKVVEHGSADDLFICTSGIGLRDARAELGAHKVKPGDKVILSGPIGDHGVTILLARGDLALEADLTSDTRSVWPLVEALLAAAGPGLRWLRDPTRGGVATALNELARDAACSVTLDDAALPVRGAVRGACELLGLDPLHVANEGQFLAVVAPDHADAALAALHACPGGAEAGLIGEISADEPGTVLSRLPYGGCRVVDMLAGDPLPRIC